MTRVTRAIALVGFLLSVPAMAAVSQSGSMADRAAAQASAAGPAPVVLNASRHDTSPTLRAMPLLPPWPIMGQAHPPGPLPGRQQSGPAAGRRDPVQQTFPGPAALPAPVLNFNGLDNGDLVVPPDPNGDIGHDPATGKKYYVQMVNLSFAVWDVTGTQTRIYGPARNNTLWQGFGGPCQSTNDGDPIVLFDGIADRWLMSQFALPNYPAGPYYQCIAISQTANPTGSWYRYEFKVSDTKMNDYPKFGVWPDGYYYSVNQFSNCPACTWAGAGVVAFERERMLAGLPARLVYFDLHGQDPNLGGLLPSDLDGPPPPSFTPNYFVTVDDDAWGYSPDQVQVWQFHVDWANPSANSSFTRSALLPAAAMDLGMCGGSRNCVPQPVTSVGLDPAAGQMMHRLQYRNFGAYQVLVGNVTADVDGLNHAGIRWFELRKAGGGWSIHQQSTYAPDADHRWMGSIAMNGSGEIALGYSVSSKTVYPSVRYTGRLAGDPFGQMSLGEGTLVVGTGSQTHSTSRWGDYSMMAVDPADDCTFWYTQEYYEVTSNASWRTRIGSFQLADCAALPTPTATSTSTPTATSTSTPTATSTPNFQWRRYLPVVLSDVGVSIGP
jgi:hypothetical protein